MGLSIWAQICSFTLWAEICSLGSRELGFITDGLDEILVFLKEKWPYQT